jgi:hypothetical protein
MEKAINEMIKFLNSIYRHRYKLKGFYRSKDPKLIIIYPQDSAFKYLVKVEPIYVLDIRTFSPMSSSYIKTELTDEIKILIKKAL